MASADTIIETPHNGDENAMNGDGNRLEYSGLSEENLNVPESNNTIAKEIAQDFGEELEEHGAPAPSAKAIKREINESHAFSDDEFPKTLTTLETVKKPLPPPLPLPLLPSAQSSTAISATEIPTAPTATEADEDEICPIEADEDEFDLLEVYNADDENKDGESTSDGGGGGDSHGNVAKVPSYEPNRRKQQFTVLTNDGRSKLHTPKLAGKGTACHGDDGGVVVTPNKPIPIQSPGTIEIPRELITSDVSVISPIIINHIKNPTTNSDDLIAILEGDDNGCVNDASVEHYELSLPSAKTNTNGEQKHMLTAEEQREIAIEQIMSLPKKKKGRPKLNQALKAARDAKLIKKTAKNSLVNSLVSDWDENDAKNDDATETEIVVEIRPQKKRAIVEPIQPAFRRSRIIKKKIIWDPDAPETAINYASLAHTSGAGPVKRQRKSIAKKTEAIEAAVAAAVADETEVMDATLPLVSAPKKKKTSEIDKLLGDEGAANMLNSLHQGNNNNNKVDGTSPGKIPRTKAIKLEACSAPNATAVSAKTKTAKSTKETKEVTTPQKQQQANATKKNATPKSVAAGKKRGPKTSESWDYIYKSRPDDCMIIRRRSNSSYSSTASLNRASIDLPSAPLINDFDGTDNEHEIEIPAKRSRSNKDKNFEFAKPKARKAGKSDSDAKYVSSFDEAKNSMIDTNNVFINHKANKSQHTDDIDLSAVPIKLENGNDNGAKTFTQIDLCRFEHFTQIILHANDSNSQYLFNVQLLKELEAALHSLENDKTCKLVLLTTAGESFCGGIDYSTLVQSSGEKRRLSAIDLSKKLSNFVQSLATFKKPLVAYVRGLVNGLGARMLPLFDVVWAHADSSFNVKCHQYGEIIEGTALLTVTDKIDYNAKAKLLFLNEVMNADGAKDCNMVSQVLKGGRAEQRVLIECSKLATNSVLTLETCRLIQQQHMLPKLKDSLKIEQKQLLQHWTKSNFVDKLSAQQH